MKNITNQIFICHKQVNNDTKSNSYSLKRQQNYFCNGTDNLKGEIKQFVEKVRQGGKIQRYRTLRLKKDGNIINISITISPVFDVSGEFVAISDIARDITTLFQNLVIFAFLN